MNNRILKLTLILVRLMQAGYGIILLFFLYLSLSPVFHWPLPNEIMKTEDSWLLFEFSKAEEFFSSTFNTVFYSLRSMLISLLLVLALQSLARIIQSIRSLSAFREDTIRHFKRIGVLMLTSFIISSIAISFIDSRLSLEFSPDLQYLLFALVSMILAEVFKEGNKLWEDNQLTI